MRNVLRDSIYNGYDLSITNKKDEGFYVEILQALGALFDSMIKSHGKVFFAMFVLKYPAGSALEYPVDNSLLSRFIEALTLYYKRKKVDQKYLWVREASKTGQFHYHFILLLDGDYIQNAYGILQKASELWQGCLGIENGNGLVHLCTTGEECTRYGGIKILRNDPEFNQVLNKCYQLASYLAKCYSKEGLPRYVNGFGSSRLPQIYPA